jgi:uncharacterized protein (DUF2141 family)
VPGQFLVSGAMLLAAATPLPPRELRGGQDAECRPNEPGPALVVELFGLKDRNGLLRMELYPPNDKDFLSDDKALIAAGKPFRRIEVVTPPSGNPVLCIRAPHPGPYAVAILHDRDGNHKFGPFSDGVSAPGKIPHIGFTRPHASYATVTIGPGVTQMRATMQYMHILGFAPQH